LALLASPGQTFQEKTVLEIGINKGGRSYSYAKAATSKILESDFSKHLVPQEAIENEQDLPSYKITCRPNTKDRALTFCKNGINHMTTNDN
jgi:hypothetical protein